MSIGERRWEVWNKEHVSRLEKETWGTPGKGGWNEVGVLLNMVSGLIDKDTSVLEIGPGIGHFYYMIKDRVKSYTGVDSSKAIVDRFKELFPEADIRHGDIFDMTDIPSASTVVCLNVLTHLPNDLFIPLKNLWDKTEKKLIFAMRNSGDKPSWYIERNNIPMPNHYEVLDNGKVIIIRATSKKETEDMINRLEGVKSFRGIIYDDRLSIYEVLK